VRQAAINNAKRGLLRPAPQRYYNAQASGMPGTANVAAGPVRTYNANGVHTHTAPPLPVHRGKQGFAPNAAQPMRPHRITNIVSQHNRGIARLNHI